MTLKLQFDANQEYQLDAVNSVADLFTGLPRRAQDYGLETGDAVPNLPAYDSLDPFWLLGNLQKVQDRNGIVPEAVRMTLWQDNGSALVGQESWQYPHFTLEMETGTGKTYVYLRTIYELRKRYGFGKFIIVVPSVAIYEGVVKNIEITRDHFRALYGNETVNLTQYEGEQLSRLRSFAASTFCEVLVMTLDSFNKTSNVIYKASEKLPGEKLPYEYVQAVRPILILDEPQNMESETAQRALRALHPLFALRYSATHRSSPNLAYRLTPVDAYRRGLVKKIDVVGVTERENANRPVLVLKEIARSRGRGGFAATVRTLVTTQGRTSEQELALKQGDALSAKTKREEHAGYVVSEINAAEGTLSFENGEVLRLNADDGQTRLSVFRAQIEKTIEAHLLAQAELRARNIKVLSLFFIDRVANYTDADGIVRTLFDEAYEKLKGQSKFFGTHSAAQVREAYFAKKKVKKTSGAGNAGEAEEAIDTASKTADERKAEKAAYALIMRDKEKLLSFDEPKCFIFAHSALKEGWDNPNVFQICTLRQSGSEVERRQTLGRGLRLCVNQSGERLHDEDVNVLTVIANESYKDFAQNLQQEYVATGDAPPPLPTNSRTNDAMRNDTVFYSNEFERFWNRLIKPVRYVMNVDTPALIEECAGRLNKPDTQFPHAVIAIERGRITPLTGSVRVDAIEAGRAQLTFKLIDEHGDEFAITKKFREGEDLSELRKNDVNLKRLGNFRVIREDGFNKVAFAVPGFTLEVGEARDFSAGAWHRVSERATLAAQEKYPVFNLIDRAAKELGMTKPTIHAIFRAMRAERKKLLLENPEGFAGVFMAELRNGLAEHVAQHLSFVTVSDIVYADKDELFPPTRKYAQREVREAGSRGLYDRVQTDSSVEESFVQQLRHDDRVEFYFKFPSGFKIDLPKIIGNYNPDWGIARLDPDSPPVIHKVRETKGTVNLAALRFPSERRKIECARKYFATIGIDYREVTGEMKTWWQPKNGEMQMGLG